MDEWLARWKAHGAWGGGKCGPAKAPTPAAEAELREAILRHKRNCPRPSCGRSGNARGHPVGANLFARRRTWHFASSPRQPVGSYRTVGKARTGDGIRFWAEPVGALLAGDLLRSGSKPDELVLPDTPRRLVSGPLRAPSLPSLPPKAPTPAAEAELREAMLRQKRNCPRPSCGRSGVAQGHPAAESELLEAIL